MTVLGVMASGEGTLFQSIIDHIKLGVLRNVTVAVLVCNNPKERANALQRAHQAGVASEYIDHRNKAIDDFNNEIAAALRSHSVDAVVLAGWLRIVEPSLVDAYKWKMLNTHPGDPIRFGGKGMYGDHVHEAALRSGVNATFPTVQYVDYGVDTGPIILQEVVPVKPNDSVRALRERVAIHERRMLPKAIQLHVDGLCVIEDDPAGSSGSREPRPRLKILASKAWYEEWNLRQAAYIEHQAAQAPGEFGRALSEILG